MELLCAELLADATEAAGDADHLVVSVSLDLHSWKSSTW